MKNSKIVEALNVNLPVYAASAHAGNNFILFVGGKTVKSDNRNRQFKDFCAKISDSILNLQKSKKYASVDELRANYTPVLISELT